MLTSKDKRVVGLLALIVGPVLIMSLFAGGGPAELGGDGVAPVRSGE